MTANALIGSDEMFSRHGFDGFISKPIDVRRLNALLNKFVRGRHPEEAKEYKPSMAAIPPDETRTKLLQVFCCDAEKAGLNRDAEFIAAHLESFIEKLETLVKKSAATETVCMKDEDAHEGTAYLAERRNGLKRLLEHIKKW